MAESTTGRVAIHELEDAGAALVWRAGGLARVAEALRGEVITPRAEQAVDELLRLMSVLRTGRSSPAAADALIDVLRREPAARAHVRKRLGPVGGIDRARSFAEREGRAVAVRAPVASAPVPSGALPVRALVDPAGRDRARAHSSPGKPRKDPR